MRESVLAPRFYAARVIRVVDEPWRIVGHVRRPPKPDEASTSELFVVTAEVAHG